MKKAKRKTANKVKISIGSKKKTVKWKAFEYVWRPPTKEEIAKKKKDEKNSMLRELKELGIYLEGMVKAQHHLNPLGLSHVHNIWSAIEFIKNAPE